MRLSGLLDTLLGKPDSLLRRATTAGMWNVAGLGGSHLLRLASNLIMSRILLPEAFGVIALVMMLLTTVEMLSDVGISQSVIRSSRGEDPHFLRAAWTIQLFRRSLFLASGMVLIGTLALFWAPVFAPKGTVYADPDLPLLIIASSIFMIIQGLGSTNFWVAQRRLQFQRIILVGLVSQSISISAMISISLVHASVWTLLAGMVAGAAAGAILSHIVFPGPRMAIVHDRSVRTELWSFGKWIMASSVLSFASSNADKIILGIVLSSTSFGNYVIALTWIGAVNAVTSKISETVIFPALSEMHRRGAGEAAHALSKLSIPISILSIFGFFGAALVVPVLIKLLYTFDYYESATMVPILAVGVLNSHFSPLSKLLLAQGDSKAIAVYSGLSAALVCIALPIAYQSFGIPWALLAVAISPTLASLWLIMRVSSRNGILVAPQVCWLGGTLGIGFALTWAIHP
jgi:O-antigen/teichoic acid export membrane protein